VGSEGGAPIHENCADPPEDPAESPCLELLTDVEIGVGHENPLGGVPDPCNEQVTITLCAGGYESVDCD
jgi:hypothetical protein